MSAILCSIFGGTSARQHNAFIGMLKTTGEMLLMPFVRSLDGRLKGGRWLRLGVARCAPG